RPSPPKSPNQDRGREAGSPKWPLRQLVMLFALLAVLLASRYWSSPNHPSTTNFGYNFSADGGRKAEILAEIPPPDGARPRLRKATMDRIEGILNSASCPLSHECEADGYTLRSVDVNEDGLPEYIVVPPGMCGSGGCRELLFMREGVWKM